MYRSPFSSSVIEAGCLYSPGNSGPITRSTMMSSAEMERLENRTRSTERAGFIINTFPFLSYVQPVSNFSESFRFNARSACNTDQTVFQSRGCLPDRGTRRRDLWGLPGG